MATPSTPPRPMRGATSGAAGASGYAPAPAAGDQDKALHGDGTYRSITGASSATKAEALAGTNSTKFITPATGSAHALAGLAGYDNHERAVALRPLPRRLHKLFNQWIAETQNGLNVALGLTIGERRNVWQYTEDVGSNRYAVTNLTKGTDTIVVDGITLTKVTFNSLYSQIYSQISGLGLTPFEAGSYYIASLFIYSAKEVEQWPGASRTGNNSNVFERKLVAPGKLNRVWTLWKATANNSVDVGGVGTVAYGSGSPNSSPTWPGFGGYASGSSAGDNACTFYIGGFQIEKVSSDGRYGFAAIGDSTMQGSAGGDDNANSLEWVGQLAAHLNVQGFNRGVGGNQTSSMDARWATDITPLKDRCKYVIIQPSAANDIPNGVALATTQGYLNSMVTKAVTDGLIPVICVPACTTGIAANSTYKATYDALCLWIRQTFPLVIDIAAVVNDPWDNYQLRRQTNWAGDGTHFGSEAKRAVARHAAGLPFWNFPCPSPYQKVAVTTFTPPDFSIYGGYKQAMGANLAANTAVLASGTVTVSNTRVTASSKVRLTRQAKNSSTAIGSLCLGSVTAGTSFVIQALKSDGTVETGDASTVLWEIVEPTA